MSFTIIFQPNDQSALINFFSLEFVNHGFFYESSYVGWNIEVLILSVCKDVTSI